jgi:hypothetical protein
MRVVQPQISNQNAPIPLPSIPIQNLDEQGAEKASKILTPAQAGVQKFLKSLDPGFRRMTSQSVSHRFQHPVVLS